MNRSRRLTPTDLTNSSKFVAKVPPALHAQAQTQMQTHAQGTAAATKLKEAMTTNIAAHTGLTSVAAALTSAVALATVTAQLHTTTVPPVTVTYVDKVCGVTKHVV